MIRTTVALLLCVATAGCYSYLREADERALNDLTVRQSALQGPAEGILTTPEGDVGVIQRAPIPTEDLCYMRSRFVRGALVPIRCSQLGRLVN
jgi:hypothetical protein